MLGAPNQSQPPITPSPSHTLQCDGIEFTYRHDKFPEQNLEHKHVKYDPLISILENNGWKVNPFITIMAGVRGTIHKHPTLNLNKLTIPNPTLKTS
jgi:hypothetical protein